MKTTNKLPIAIVGGAALLLSSCYVPYGTYGTYGGAPVATAPVATAAVAPAAGAVAYDANAAWSAASYDASGYPIYGYSYGQPVYGYTDAGVAITTMAALTALCFIPDWGPASWYRGPAYAPRGQRFASPPRYSRGHSPNVRPSNHGGGNRGGGSHGGRR